jgi:flavin reductase (DIM6/NTAB) family NADH-FMN oxidoreductase RutF
VSDDRLDDRVDDGAAALEEIAARLDYPMFVVTAAAGGERSGCLVGFTTQVSIRPARFLVALSVRNHTYGVAARAGHLAVHVLAREQRRLAELFGELTGDVTDKFASCRWHDGPYGVPVLDDAAGWLAGPVLDRVPFGDHTGFVLEPTHGTAGDRTSPLLTFADVRDMEPGHDA